MKINRNSKVQKVAVGLVMSILTSVVAVGGATSAHAVGSTDRTLTWTPATTKYMLTESGVALLPGTASASDDADVFGFEVDPDANAANCSIDPATHVLTFSSMGSCDVRATVAGSATYVDAASAYSTIVIDLPSNTISAAAMPSTVVSSTSPIVIGTATSLSGDVVATSVDPSSDSNCSILAIDNVAKTITLTPSTPGWCNLYLQSVTTSSYKAAALRADIHILPSTDGSLSSLSITDAAGNPLTLGSVDPAVTGFSPSINYYTVAPSNDIANNSVIVRATANSPFATIKVGTTTVSNGQATTVSLTSQTTSLTVSGIAQSGARTTYNLLLHKMGTITNATPVGTTKKVTFNLTNVLNTPVTQSGVTITGDSDFTVVANTAANACALTGTYTLGARGTCAVSVQFAPTKVSSSSNPAKFTVSIVGTTSTGGAFKESITDYGQTLAGAPTITADWNTVYVSTTQLPTPTSVSTGAFTYSVTSAGTSTCTIDANSPRVTFAKAGSCTILISQAADANYAAASKSVTIYASLEPQPITLASSASNALPGSSVALTVSGVKGTGQQTFSITSASTSGCSVKNGAITLAGVGDCYVKANIGTDSRYAAYVSPEVKVSFAKGAQILTWQPTALSASADAASLNPGALASSTGNGALSYAIDTATSTEGCAVDATTGILTWTSAGNCAVIATAAETDTYLAASTSATFTINAVVVVPPPVTPVDTSTPTTPNGGGTNTGTNGGSNNGSNSGNAGGDNNGNNGGGAVIPPAVIPVAAPVTQVVQTPVVETPVVETTSPIAETPVALPAQTPVAEITHTDPALTAEKSVQPLPVVVLSKTSVWPSKNSPITISGLVAGQVVASRSASICSVSNTGVVTALKSGTCVIAVTTPADATHLASTRTFSLVVLAPSITVTPSTKIKGAIVLAVKAGPSYASKKVEVWTKASKNSRSILIGQVKLDKNGSASLTTLRGKGATLLLKFNGKVIGTIASK